MKSAPADADIAGTGFSEAGLSEEEFSILRLIRTPQIGPLTFYRLVEHYGSARKALDAVPGMASRGGGKQPLQLFSREAAEAEIAACAKAGARLITFQDAAYPEALRHIADAPPILAVRGDASLFSRPMVAMVGARNASLPGCRFAENVSRGLAEAGYVVVSGLARGIDAAAHAGAAVKHTVAVVAGGVDHIYPRENTTLYHAIAREGAVVSECAFGTIPKPEHFPRRNRIISGMARAVIVVEASARSGSLITARFALEQGREVMAVPGSPLDPRAEGPNKLLKAGATLIASAEDVIEALAAQRENYHGNGPDNAFLEALPEGFLPSAPMLDEESVGDVRDRIVTCLSLTPVHVDDVIAREGGQEGARAVLAALLELELAGRLTRHPGNRVALAS